MIWLDDTKNNWNVTDSYSGRIFAYNSLMDIKHDQLVLIQYQKALKQIKDSVDVFDKVDQVIENNKDRIINENNLDKYSDEFREYLTKIYESAHYVHFECWLKENSRISKDIMK